MREVLVLEPLDDVSAREEDERVELVAPACQRELVEVGERDDEPRLVLVDEPPKHGHVLGVVDARHQHVCVGVIERGRQRIDVGGDRSRTCTAESADDVDALSRTREEDGRHGGQYSRNGRLASAEAASTAATTRRMRRGSRSNPYPNASAHAGAVVSM